jgi:hypothetical protein
VLDIARQPPAYLVQKITIQRSIQQVAKLALLDIFQIKAKPLVKFVQLDIMSCSSA